MKKIILLMLLISLLHHNAYGQIFYVSKSGNDGNKGIETSPFLTIQKAVNSIQSDNDEIWIKPGNYFESIAADNKTRAHIKIKGTGPGVNVLAVPGKNALILAYLNNWIIKDINFFGGKNSVVSVYRCEEGQIENCKIGNQSDSTKLSSSISVLSSPKFAIKNCLIDAYSFVGISLSNSRETVVKGNDISNASSLLITFSKGCDYTTLEENYFHDKVFPGTSENGMIECRDNIGSKIIRNLIVGKNNGAYGSCIGIRGPYVACENITVENNTIIAGGASAGINFAANTLSSTVKNNIIIGGGKSLSSGSGAKKSTSSEVEVDYNLFYNYRLELIDDSKNVFKIGKNNIISDPLFEDTAHYKLSVNSPCIDAGFPVSPAPAGGGIRVDIGRYEFLK